MVGLVSAGDQVVPAALALRPDVAVLDVQMPGLDGLAAAGALRSQLPGCRVVILTTFGRPGYLRRAMEAGASGFLVKDAPPEQLVDTIRRVHAGRQVVDPALAAESLAVGGSPFTARERDVLAAAADGSHGRGDRRPAVPVRGHGAQLPVHRDQQDVGANPGRGGGRRDRPRLALTPSSHGAGTTDGAVHVRPIRRWGVGRRPAGGRRSRAAHPDHRPVRTSVSRPTPSWCWAPPSTTVTRRRSSRPGCSTRWSCTRPGSPRTSSPSAAISRATRTPRPRPARTGWSPRVCRPTR